MKTEHAGAKNGGGFWGPRAWAKALSRTARRTADKQTVGDELEDYLNPRWDDCDAFCPCWLWLEEA